MLLASVPQGRWPFMSLTVGCSISRRSGAASSAATSAAQHGSCSARVVGASLPAGMAGLLHHHHQHHQHSGKRHDAILFFLIAVAYKVPWTAVSSLLGQLATKFHDPRVLLHLNMAYFLPSVPALLLHSSLQQRLERALGLPRSALARFVAGLGGLVVLCLLLPACCASLPALLAATAAVGVCYSLAFSTSYQLVAHFAPQCTVALTTGFVSCGVVVLLADLACKRGPTYSPAGLGRLFALMALQTAVGLLAAAALLRRHWRRLAAVPRGALLAATASDSGSSSDAGSTGWSALGGRRVLGVPQAGGVWLRPGAAGGGVLRSGTPAMQLPGDGGSGSLRDWGSGSSLDGCLPAAAAIAAGGHAQQQLQHASSGSLHGLHAAADATGGGSSGGGGAAVAIHLASTSQAAAAARGSGGGAQRAAARTRLLRDRLSWLAWKLWRGHARAAASLEPLAALARLAAAIWPAALGLLLSVGSSMLAFPVFTYVPRDGAFGEHLPQVLFYVRQLGDLLGRLVPLRLQLRSSRGVLAAGTAKASLLLLLLPALLRPRLVGGDAALALLVAANWWLSGYVNTGAYLLAPRLVDSSSSSSHSKRPVPRSSSGGGGGGGSSSSMRSQAGGLMAACFQASCFLGLLGALAIQELLLEGWGSAQAGGSSSVSATDLAARVAEAAAALAAGAAAAEGAAAGSAAAPAALFVNAAHTAAGSSLSQPAAALVQYDVGAGAVPEVQMVR